MNMEEALLRVIELGAESTRASTRLYDHLERRISELEERLVEQDHAKVPRAAFEELHNRVDAIERMRR